VMNTPRMTRIGISDHPHVKSPMMPKKLSKVVMSSLSRFFAKLRTPGRGRGRRA
jgi:hypothetical protein